MDDRCDDGTVKFTMDGKTQSVKGVYSFTVRRDYPQTSLQVGSLLSRSHPFRPRTTSVSLVVVVYISLVNRTPGGWVTGEGIGSL